MDAHYSRRSLLRRTATLAGGAASFSIIPARVLGADAPSKKITIGCIGLGNHGVGRNLNMFLRQPDAQVVAVCASIEAEIVTFERPKCVSISTARAPAPHAVEGTV